MYFFGVPKIKVLRGRRFMDLQEICMAVRKAIFGYNKEWYNEIYNKWVKRHRNCTHHNGKYFEKLHDAK